MSKLRLFSMKHFLFISILPIMFICMTLAVSAAGNDHVTPPAGKTNEIVAKFTLGAASPFELFESGGSTAVSPFVGQVSNGSGNTAILNINDTTRKLNIETDIGVSFTCYIPSGKLSLDPVAGATKTFQVGVTDARLENGYCVEISYMTDNTDDTGDIFNRMTNSGGQLIGYLLKKNNTGSHVSSGSVLLKCTAEASANYTVSWQDASLLPLLPVGKYASTLTFIISYKPV